MWGGKEMLLVRQVQFLVLVILTCAGKDTQSCTSWDDCKHTEKSAQVKTIPNCWQSWSVFCFFLKISTNWMQPTRSQWSCLRMKAYSLDLAPLKEWVHSWLAEASEYCSSPNGTACGFLLYSLSFHYASPNLLLIINSLSAFEKSFTTTTKTWHRHDSGTIQHVGYKGRRQYNKSKA